MQGERPELPQGEAAEGDEEIGLVELAELDAETVVLDQERIAAFGTVRCQQEFLVTELDRQGATDFG